MGFKEDSLVDYDRIELIHLFPQYYRTSNIFIRYIRRAFLFFQKKVGFKYRRSSEDFVFKKGPTWVSVTHEFVNYLIQNRVKVPNCINFHFLQMNNLFKPFCIIQDFVHIYTTILTSFILVCVT